MKHVTFFIFFLLGLSLYNSQSKILFDTLSKYNYLQLEDKFYNYKNNNKIKESNSVAQYYLNKAKIEKKEDQIAEGYVMIQYNKNLPTALKYIDSLEIIKKNSQEDRYPARIYILKGLLYYNYDNEKLALENFITALNYAKVKNNKRQIGIAEIQIAFLNNYIGKHKEAANTLQYYYDHPDLLGNQDIDYIRINLADSYLDIKENDKAIKLIKKSLKNTLENNDNTQYNRCLLLQGVYNLNMKNYSKSILDLEKSKNYFLKNNYILDASYSMLFLGQSYNGLKQKNKAAQNFESIDSLIQKTNITFPELREVYTYLIDYYKEKKDKERQLYYIERFLKVDKFLDSQFRYISRELPKKYDTPKLLKEKESIINDLENRKYFSYSTIGILLFLLSALGFFFYKSEKKHRKIAQDLIKSINEKKKVVEIEKKIILSTETNDTLQIDKSTSKTIAENTVQNILQELERFEINELFLRKGITLSSLAKDFKTNSTYLSDVINSYKEKNFATYLNDLRIDYALNRLVKDKRFRSYKLTVVAEELGYNNEQAFALAFRKKTGTILRTYIKEINQAQQ